ncbi:alpha-galactosidase A-like isoform X2 [Corticium candelabrum]|uniref:alpha-galactosidase A-like isoform X2 n=1 Tax=Corticium candelabrum TaxID=121492 RepID=UPI002E273636|nr:alpha-galactosidase A-like isoform X2 [Corticium candelabrum]
MLVGWNTYNYFRRNYNEEIIYQITDALIASGMQKVGYKYVNIDGGWWAGVGTGSAIRNASGYLEYDKAKFPHGMKALADYLHSRSLKFGMYTDAGKHFCNRDQNASEGYESKDAALFASWDADFVKVDACGTTEKPEILMSKWRNALNATGRPMVFSNCLNGCTYVPDVWQPWCANYSNLWRTCEDIDATWQGVLTNLDSLVGKGKYGGPNRWNNPDMLEVGNGDLTDVENKAHFSLWCVTSSPLIAGNDLRNMSNATKAILTNKAAIAINQEYAGNSGDLLIRDGNTEVWYKPLPNKEHALVLFNRDDAANAIITVPFSKFNVSETAECTVGDVWTSRVDKMPAKHNVTKNVGPHDVAFVRLEFCH